MALGMTGLLRGVGEVVGGGQRLGAIHLTHSQRQSEPFCKVDDREGALWRNCLPSLIVADISLCAINALGERGLRQAKKIADSFDLIHVEILALLLLNVNSNASLPDKISVAIVSP